MKNANHTKDIVPPRGDEKWALCSPLILLMGYNIFFRMTCDHSFRKITSFYKFSVSLLMNGVLRGVLDSPNPPKSDKVSSYLFTNLHKTASKQD
jgi:hypothetical protein